VGFIRSVLNIELSGVDHKCIDYYAAQMIRVYIHVLHIFPTRHKTNAYSEHLTRSHNCLLYNRELKI
jgi:hypothetical protein